MNLMKKIVFVVLVMAWLLARAVWDLIITFVCLMRVALGKNGELASIITFLLCMTASVLMFGFTGILIAAFQTH